MLAQSDTIGIFKITFETYSHFCMLNPGNVQKWIRDDLKLKNLPSHQVNIYKQIDDLEILANPFILKASTTTKDYKDCKEYTVIIANKMYQMFEISRSTDQLVDLHVIHYIFARHDAHIHSIGIQHAEILSKLSEREREVLILMAEGNSMSRIGQMLSLSPHTIDSHRLNLCRKLNVRRTTQLAVWAYKLGLLDRD